MSDYSVPSGTFSYGNTLTESTADTVAFPYYRAGYASVTNVGTTVIYARADGQAATVAGEGCIAVLPGQSALVANGLPLWYQSANVLVQGDDNANGQSKAGGVTTPGTTVSLISTAAVPYTVALV